MADFHDTGGECGSTDVVRGLSLQIADEVSCVVPDALARFDAAGGIAFAGDGVLPYLSPGARDALQAAVTAQGGELVLNSAFRTVAQQHLIHHWFNNGNPCGYYAAAAPGDSNHESGRAFDVSEQQALEYQEALGSQGWTLLEGDPVHFDHLASPDLRGYDVLAFQRLWNRNRPDDLIDEDGAYGTATEARLVQAPADGFAQGACGGAVTTYAAELRAIEAPAVLAPGERAQATVEVRNTGTAEWIPGATFLGTTAPRDRESVLHDPESWPSVSRAATVEAATPGGASGRFRFSIVAPASGDALLDERFELVEEGVT